MKALLSFSSPRQRGFSLIELMISLLLGLLVVGGASAMFLSNKQSYRSGEALSQVQEGTRSAFELIARDARSASLTGCGNTGRVANVITNATTYWWADWNDVDQNTVVAYSSSTADNNPALLTGTAPTNHVTGTDSIILIGADDITYSTAAGADGSSTAPFKTNETSALQNGDVIIVCTTGGGSALQQATIAQISGTTGGGGYVTGTTGVTPANCTTGLGYPTNCTTANTFTYPFSSTLISKLKSVSWYLGVNPQGTNSLYRMTLVNSGGAAVAQAQEIVRNVTSFALTYHIPTNTQFVDATTIGTANFSAIDAIQITMQLQATDLHAGTGSGTKQIISRKMVATVALRNRIN